MRLKRRGHAPRGAIFISLFNLDRIQSTCNHPLSFLPHFLEHCPDNPLQIYTVPRRLAYAPEFGILKLQEAV